MGGRSVAGKFILNRELMTRAKKQMMILHPLPRIDEIAYELDGDERSFYFRQSSYGVSVRMAITALLLGALKMPTSTI